MVPRWNVAPREEIGFYFVCLPGHGYVFKGKRYHLAPEYDATEGRNASFYNPGACLLRNVDAYRMLHKGQAPLMTSVQGIYDSTAHAHYCRLLLLRTPCL